MLDRIPTDTELTTFFAEIARAAGAHTSSKHNILAKACLKNQIQERLFIHHQQILAETLAKFLAITIEVGGREYLPNIIRPKNAELIRRALRATTPIVIDSQTREASAEEINICLTFVVNVFKRATNSMLKSNLKYLLSLYIEEKGKFFSNWEEIKAQILSVMKTKKTPTHHLKFYYDCLSQEPAVNTCLDAEQKPSPEPKRQIKRSRTGYTPEMKPQDSTETIQALLLAQSSIEPSPMLMPEYVDPSLCKIEVDKDPIHTLNTWLAQSSESDLERPSNQGLPIKPYFDYSCPQLIFSRAIPMFCFQEKMAGRMAVVGSADECLEASGFKRKR